MFQGKPVLHFSYSLREAIGVSYMLMIKVTLHHNQFLFSPHSQGLVQGDLKNKRKANEQNAHIQGVTNEHQTTNVGMEELSYLFG